MEYMNNNTYYSRIDDLEESSSNGDFPVSGSEGQNLQLSVYQISD